MNHYTRAKEFLEEHSTCKECIHYYACSAKGGLFNEKDESKEMLCTFFKPKSRFVELPCEVGAKVYFVGLLTQQIVPSKVVSIFYNNGGFHLSCENHLIISVTEQLGKTVFLSKEEAENALKEREKE